MARLATTPSAESLPGDDWTRAVIQIKTCKRLRWATSPMAHHLAFLASKAQCSSARARDCVSANLPAPRACRWAASGVVICDAKKESSSSFPVASSPSRFVWATSAQPYFMVDKTTFGHLHFHCHPAPSARKFACLNKVIAKQVSARARTANTPSASFNCASPWAQKHLLAPCFNGSPAQVPFPRPSRH